MQLDPGYTVDRETTRSGGGPPNSIHGKGFPRHWTLKASPFTWFKEDSASVNSKNACVYGLFSFFGVIFE